MNSRALAIQSVTDLDVIEFEALFPDTLTTKEDSRLDNGAYGLSDGLLGLGELRSLDGTFLPLPPPSGSEFDLSADPPSFIPWVNFYELYGESLLLAPITTAPRPPSPPSPLHQLDIVAALAHMDLHQGVVLEAAPLPPVPHNSPLVDDSEVLQASPPKAASSSSSSSPAPPSPSSSATLPTDSGYESNSSPRSSASSPVTSTRAKRSSQRVARRRTPYPSPSLTASSSLGVSSSSSSLPSSPVSATLSAAQLRVSRRRNAQVSAPVTSSGSSTVSLRLTASDYATKTCPHCCKRFPRMGNAELRRHFKCHKGAKNVWDWVCTGVPIELATSRYNVSEEQIAQFVAQGRTMWVGDRLMVGGCSVSLSRSDALQRHLRYTQKNCVGDHNGDWQVGVQKKRDEKE